MTRRRLSSFSLVRHSAGHGKPDCDTTRIQGSKTPAAERACRCRAASAGLDGRAHAALDLERRPLRPRRFRNGRRRPRLLGRRLGPSVAFRGRRRPGAELAGRFARWHSARVRPQQRPRYGFYLDHVLDAFGTSFLLGGLALSGYISPLIAVGLLAAYVLLMLEAALATYTLGVFPMSFAWFGPTELRIVLALGTLALWRDPHPVLLGERYRLFDVGGAVAIVGMVAVFLVSAVRSTAKLYREEPLP